MITYTISCRISKHAIRIFALLCILALNVGAYAKRLLPEVLVVQDYRNNIAATSSAFYPSNFPAVEIDTTSSTGAPAVVYVRNTTVKIAFTWYNPNVASDNGTFTIFDATYTPDGGSPTSLLVNGASSFSEPVFIPGHGYYSTSEIQITGLPNHVTLGTLNFLAKVHSPLGLDGFGMVNTMRTYIVDATPTDNQTVPWTDLLEYSCKWATGLTGQVDCTTACTRGLYNDALLTFPATDFSSRWIDSTTGKFKLSNFFAATTTKYGNSADISSLLSLAANSLGEQNSLLIFQAAVSARNRLGFITNDVKPIGSSTSRRIYLLSHQVLVVNDEVYDSTFAQSLDLSGFTYNDVPVSWPEMPFWQTTNSSSPPTYLGLVSRYGYPYGNPLKDIQNLTVNYVEPSFADGPVAPSMYPVTLTGIQ